MNRKNKKQWPRYFRDKDSVWIITSANKGHRLFTTSEFAGVRGFITWTLKGAQGLVVKKLLKPICETKALRLIAAAKKKGSA